MLSVDDQALVETNLSESQCSFNWVAIYPKKEHKMSWLRSSMDYALSALEIDPDNVDALAAEEKAFLAIEALREVSEDTCEAIAKIKEES